MNFVTSGTEVTEGLNPAVGQRGLMRTIDADERFADDLLRV